MAYSLEISGHVDRVFRKLLKKDRKKLDIIHRKLQQILEDPARFKPLKGDMHGSRRVHINGSYVLVYEVDEKRKTARLLDFEHHDNVY